MSFEPGEWSSVYEAPRPSPPALVFRRGAALARAACLETACAGERWVDVGAGTGHLAADLATAGLRVSAVDNDPGMVAAARTRFGDRLQVACADAAELPFEDGAVDGLVATALVGLLPEPGPFLAEARRVLRPGGRVVLTVTNGSGAAQRLARLGRYGAPARRFRRDQIAAELLRAGLELERDEYFNLFVARGRMMVPPRRVAMALERRAARAGSLLARNLLVVAAKPAV